MKKLFTKKFALLFLLGLTVQSINAIDWNTDTLKINIQPEPGTLGNGGFIGADVPDAPEGYLVDNGMIYEDKGNGFTYGWNMDISSTMRYRINAADVTETDFRRLTLCHLQKGDPATWEIALPSGKYHVFLCGGDAINAVDFTNSFDIEGTVVEDQTPMTRGYDEFEATVELTDGNLTIKPAEGLGVNSKLNYILISKETTAPSLLTEKPVEVMDVYSNPKAKTVTLRCPDVKSKYTVDVFNTSGLLVFKKTCTSKETTLSFAGLSGGVYILKITQGQNVINHKLLLD